MSYRPRYDRGDWKAICDVCGREFKASLLRKRWDNYMVCSADWEPRQPQDFVRGVADIQTTPWQRDEPVDQFSNAKIPFIAGMAIAGVSFPTTIPGDIIPGLVPTSTFIEP